ncbi:hypothetical protein Palpr_2296 [Paludibacter propionicigenes WB4]|uniref:ATPase AAA-type core domain-containing protein n=1 Tax=Paludibacter propionicigenes (strain DSM 17365 / JCM 13257 / WB4) TaxID=694427 RepID=E4T6T8_PALPW|nr:AAA family ATPase [Paludibacter propionicigenes]ADQ80432.1 hypothetical protein Palpr_2296 [Paludibacter propionicigenes WB4]
MFDSNFQIPTELLSFRNTLPEDVNIIVGENGSGKSYMLSQLAENHLKSNNKDVVVIANSIHDKFKPHHSIRFHPLKNSVGRKYTKDVLKKSLINMSKDSSKRINFATNVLKYVGFDSKIGFRLHFKNTSLNDIDDIFDLNDELFLKYKLQDIDIEKEEREDIYSELLKYLNYSIKNKKVYNQRTYNEFYDIIWFNMNDYESSYKFSLINLFKWEYILVRNKIIEPIDVFLSKNDQIIPLLSASSGELALITSFLYITSIINEKTVILIDEPENSLHPKWQREYVKLLVDIVYLYQPHIVIATHSPLIVSGAELNVKGAKIYKAQNFELELQEKRTLNIEEIYYDLFDTIMPENRILSNIIVNQLNKLEKKEISLENFLKYLDPIYDNVRDKRQIKMLDGISKLAEKIVLQRKN